MGFSCSFKCFQFSSNVFPELKSQAEKISSFRKIYTPALPDSCLNVPIMPLKCHDFPIHVAVNVSLL